MGLKGINPFEEHADKIALGVFGLLAAGIFVWQFATPLTVQMTGGNPTTPRSAADSIRTQSSSAEAEMNSPAMPAELPPVPDLVARFDRAVAGEAQPVALVGLFPGVAGTTVPGGFDPEQPTGVGDPPTLVLAEPPAPRDLITNVFGGAVDPLEVFRISELAAAVGTEQPFDLFVPTVQASFPVGEFVAELRGERTDVELADGSELVPSRMWEGRTELIGLELERERWDPTSRAWVDRQIIAPLRGSESLLARAQSADFVAGDFGALLNDERTNRQQVRRPGFVPILSPNCWLWPELVRSLVPSPAVMEERDRLIRDIRAQEREITRLNNLLNPGTGGDGAWLIPNLDGGPFEGMPTPGSAWPQVPPTVLAQGGGGGGPRPERPDTGDADERRRERLQQQIETAQRRIDTAVERLAEMGFDRLGTPLTDPCAQTIDEPLGSLSLRDVESFTVWAHDYSAQRGTVYRYRLRAFVTNPLFGNARSLNEEQRPLAEQLLLESTWSSWSEPVQVPGEVSFFATAARSGAAIGGLGPTNARRAGAGSFELYRFIYGYWRRIEATTESGQRIAGTGTHQTELPIFRFEGSGSDRRLLAEFDTMPEQFRGSLELFLIDAPPETGAAELLLATADGQLMVQRARESGIRLDALRESARIGETAEIRRPGQQGEPIPGGGPTPMPDDAPPGGGGAPPGGGGTPPGGGGSPPDR
ncbi:MAG: hypothetical protein EA380_03965 [Phycisphaeraceae bacterium]|nr:MAG: hypothetical protein EA380_03965 [Phycisphaeraceae bacterium]